MKFVSKELAIKLKEKGFDKPCFGWYNTDNEILKLHSCEGTARLVLEHPLNCEYIIDAPTTDQVLEWLREKDIIVFCNPFFTMATKNHIMYEWNVDVFNVDTKETKEDNENVCLTYVDNDFGYVRYSSGSVNP